MSYNETIQKWNEKGSDLAAIHPAGAAGPEAWEQSGKYDADIVTEMSKLYGAIDPAQASILDYGCGPGRVSFPLCEHFKEVVGWDSSEDTIDKLSQNTIDALVPGNFDVLLKSGPTTNFDVAFSLSVFIHHTYADGVNMMKEVAGMVKSGGLLLLQIPIYDVAREAEHWSGVTVWTFDQFVAAARESGLEIIRNFTNPGAFSYKKIGPNHAKMQVLKKL